MRLAFLFQQRIFTIIGINEILPNSQMLRVAGELLCRDGAATQDLCDLAMFIGGWNSEQFNKVSFVVPSFHDHRESHDSPIAMACSEGGGTRMYASTCQHTPTTV